jgi:hypothetical protein
MRSCLWMAVVAACVGILAGCGQGVTGGTSQGLEVGGVVRRSSFGIEGLQSDIKHFQERLEAMQADPAPDKAAISGMSDLVARLQAMLPTDSSVTLQDTCGVSYYTLSPSVDPGYTVGRAQADASFTEFGPPSPWSKTLTTYAFAQSTANQQSSEHDDTFWPPGTFYETTAYAQTGPTYGCKRLQAFAAIGANGCDFYASDDAEYDTCF